jgi:hypothetical protein
LVSNYADNPDTLVEIFVKDTSNDKIRQKTKTAFVQNNINPNYNYKVSYAMSDIYRRSLVCIVWQRAIGFEKSIGECEDKFNHIKRFYKILNIYF